MHKKDASLVMKGNNVPDEAAAATAMADSVAILVVTAELTLEITEIDL